MSETVYEVIYQIEASESARRRTQRRLIAQFLGVIFVLTGLPLLAVALL